MYFFCVQQYMYVMHVCCVLFSLLDMDYYIGVSSQLTDIYLKQNHPMKISSLEVQLAKRADFELRTVSSAKVQITHTLSK